jgi:hypothetical protein
MKAILNAPIYPPVPKKQKVLGAQPNIKSLVKVQAEPTPRKSS